MFSTVRMRSSRVAAMVAIALLCAGTVSAAELDGARSTPLTLDTIRVFAQQSPVLADDLEMARRRLGERAGGAALVDGESYRGGRVGTLVDALGFAPGVFIQSRFGAEEARLSIRGSGLQRTFHGRGLELLQDGSPLNLADGGFDFQAVEPLSARYIEVYRGANALEFGAATLGGAINFVSPTGRDAPPLTLRAETGGFGYRRGQLALAGTAGRADGYVSISGVSQDGYREHSAQENYRLFGNTGFRFSDTLDGRLYLSHVDSRSELPGNLTFAEFLRDPRLPAPGNLALDQRRDYTLDRLAGKLAWSRDAGRSLTLSAFVSDKSLDHPIFQVLRQESRDYGFDLRWRGESVLGGHRNLLTAGVAWAQGNTDDDRFFNEGGRAGAHSNRFDQHARNLRAYLEDQVWLNANWVLAFGAQTMDAERDSHDRFVVDGRDESFDVGYSGVNPRLGVRYLVDANTQWFANVSRSIEPPSFGELAGGPNVTPVGEQRATTAEVGMRMNRQSLSLDVALYRARVDGELLALTDGAGNPLGTTNADRTLHQGVELGLGWRPDDRWTLSVNYLYNDFRFNRDTVFGDNELAGVPQQQLRTELRWSLGERLHVATSLEWVPNDYYVDHANSYTAPSYAVTGLRVGGVVHDRWSWFVDARNIFNQKWIASTGVVADAKGMDGRNFLPGDRCSLYAGLEAHF